MALHKLGLNVDAQTFLLALRFRAVSVSGIKDTDYLSSRRVAHANAATQDVRRWSSRGSRGAMTVKIRSGVQAVKARP